MKNKFYYCKIQIEGGKKCKIQCEDCLKYYYPLEKQIKEDK
jgi:hypothetical protein